MIVNQVVTIEGTPSYTSGAQLCKGAAAILNKKPKTIKSNPKTGIIEVVLSSPIGGKELKIKLNIDSICVSPV